MKQQAKMGSVAVIHIRSFTKTDSGIQKLMRGDTDTQTHRHKRTFIFSKYGKLANKCRFLETVS
jgi:hypothetical protein